MGCLLISFGGTHHLRFSPESCQTSRDLPKSAPYPRLKNSKRTSKCQFTVLQNRKTKKWTEWRAGAASASPWRAKRGTLPESSTYLSQLKGGPFGEKTNFRKLSMPKNWKGEPLGFLNTHFVVKCQRNWRDDLFERKTFRKKWHNAEKLLGFFNIHSVAKQQKIEWGKFFSKKVSQCRKKWKWGTLWSRPILCYAGKQEKLFWFSSLGQMVQFGAIIFCRTSNYFGQFVWIVKKTDYNSHVSLHEAPTKNIG